MSIIKTTLRTMNLRHYNQKQIAEIQRVKDEIKWYLGIEKNHDPYHYPEDKAIIEERLANILLNGFGAYLRTLTCKEEIYSGSADDKDNRVV